MTPERRQTILNMLSLELDAAAVTIRTEYVLRKLEPDFQVYFEGCIAMWKTWAMELAHSSHPAQQELPLDSQETRLPRKQRAERVELTSEQLEELTTFLLNDTTPSSHRFMSSLCAQLSNFKGLTPNQAQAVLDIINKARLEPSTTVRVALAHSLNGQQF